MGARGIFFSIKNQFLRVLGFAGAKRRAVLSYKNMIFYINMDVDNKQKSKIEKLDKIYQEYSKNLLELRKQQDQIVGNFIEALKQESIKELRRKFETSNG